MTDPSIIGRDLPADAEFADVRVGMRSISPEVTAPADGRDAGAIGITRLVQLVPSIAPCKGAALAELNWEEHRGLTSTGAEHLVAIVTRWGSDGPRDVGRIVQDLSLVDSAGTEVQRARAHWRVPAVTVVPDAARVAFEFGSVAWGKRIGERLASNAAFASTTNAFDGSIGFSAGTDEVQFRIYRGKIIEISRKAIDGGTFIIGTSELMWLRVLTDSTNDFVRRTMKGGFKVRGDGFQYVRMIKAIMLILDEARAEVTEVLSA